MLWLAAQVFLLCLISFLAGAAITYLAMRRQPAQNTADPETGAGPETAARAEASTGPQAEPETEAGAKTSAGRELAAEPQAGSESEAQPDIGAKTTAVAETEEAGPQTEPMVIKASKKSMRYHTPDSPYYNRVSGSLTFISPEEAELAGYQPWNADKVKAPAP